MKAITPALVAATLFAAPLRAQPVEAQRYVYAVWGCTESYQGAWRCSAPAELTQYESLADCQAVRAKLPQRSGLRGVSWYQCYRLPAWSPAEAAPEIAVDGAR